MSIKFECSECYEILKVKDALAGRKVRCPKCDAVNRVPHEAVDTADENPISQSRSSSKSSRSAQPQRKPTRRSRTSDDDELAELPQLAKRKKKVASNSQADSGGGVPVWAIVAGSSLGGLFLIAAIVFVAVRPLTAARNGDVAAGGATKPVAAAKVVQAQVDGNGANFRMKWEMPLGWTSEGAIERNRWPWATMKGQGQVIRLSTNRSLLGGAETMTTKGGLAEQLKMSHTLRGGKLQAENNDWVEGQLAVKEGKNGPIVYSDYEYKGVIGKGYGIRCTVIGPVLPCTLMLECGESARDKWRPTLLTIAESIHFVRLKKNGEEVADGVEGNEGIDADEPNEANEGNDGTDANESEQ